MAHHSCGSIKLIIPDLIESGLDILNPIQPEALDLARTPPCELREELAHMVVAGDRLIARLAAMLPDLRLVLGHLPLDPPVLTALAGVAVLGEPLSLRLALASAAILGGIALVLRRTSS